MKIKKKKLKTLEIDVNESGFTIWIVEEYKGKLYRHWILDGSRIKKDGRIRFGDFDDYRYQVKYSKKSRTIKLIDKCKNPNPQNNAPTIG